MNKIVLIDDHVLLRNGLAELVRSFGNTILFEADNGKDFMSRLDIDVLPDIVLLDINMPEMDGYETCEWLKNNHPSVKVLALSMYNAESSIIKMLICGAKGYILKDCEPTELKRAIDELTKKGHYFIDMAGGKLENAIKKTGGDEDKPERPSHINEIETAFLTYACTGLTDKEIADKMGITPHTVEIYRDSLFEKLNVTTRVGLVVYAISSGLTSTNKSKSQP